MTNIENPSYPTSVILRVNNERPTLDRVLARLHDQVDQNFEVVVVDDYSTDGSDQVAYAHFPAERVKLARVSGRFNYPAASNLGAKTAQGEYLVYLSGHSIPVTETWLSDGLKNFAETRVGGVFAYPLPHQDAPFVERVSANIASLFTNSRKEYRKYSLGVMGATNAIFRRDLWEKYHFNEEFKIGGEDADWAKYWMDRGFVMVQDPKFRVYHSHHLSPRQLVKQYLRWLNMLHPKDGQTIIRAKDL